MMAEKTVVMRVAMMVAQTVETKAGSMVVMMVER